MIEIRLTQGQVTVVDDCDADLAEFNWSAHYYPDSEKFYADRRGENGATVRMHRVIMARVLGRELATEEHVDHINGVTLDNRRSEIRLATKSENSRNCRKRKDNTSGYKGVHYNGSSYTAHITFNSRQLYVGSFNTPEDAAAAYDAKAKELHGDFASLNFPESMV